ncbi:Phage virion morphogenesis (putative tail completion) protein [Candidatus Magnetobacterium bavaricum]|uniref:Phage virion morphogenesis (Putative tail completion) protein n=1 Tax=Candidatus Magnetobacterium bavaricum TaxID=29290 RepID=A0A0F3GUS2_9BACT|nr:Phage virion morphogenesis (putative tail completion) protein [Candidatus Magnetobacterium bavaricum]
MLIGIDLTGDIELEEKLKALSDGIDDMTPVMMRIAGALRYETMRNFEEEGRPKWAPISQARIKQRLARGHWPGKILTDTGQLRSSVSTDYGKDYVVVGTNKVYAATHQFGRGGIAARPFLPDAEQMRPAIEAILKEYMGQE